MIVANIIYL